MSHGRRSPASAPDAWMQGRGNAPGVPSPPAIGKQTLIEQRLGSSAAAPQSPASVQGQHGGVQCERGIADRDGTPRGPSADRPATAVVMGKSAGPLLGVFGVRSGPAPVVQRKPKPAPAGAVEDRGPQTAVAYFAVNQTRFFDAIRDRISSIV